MRRPKYESHKDRAGQQEIAEAFGRHVGVQPTLAEGDMPRHDFEGKKDGKRVMFIEIRNRSNPMRRYPTYMVALHKHEYLCQMSERHGVPSYLVVRFADGKIGYWQIKRIDQLLFQVNKGGRTDRNDDRDIEDCIFLPIEQWQVIL